MDEIDSSRTPRDADELPRLARLIRLSREADFAADTRALIESLLLEALGPATSSFEAPPLSPRSKGEHQGASSSVGSDAERAPPERSAKVKGGAFSGQESASGPARDDGRARRIVALEQKLRRLIDQDADWHTLAPVGWQIATYKASAVSGARMVELAFLKASFDQLEKVLNRAQERFPDFYRHVHKNVRAHLVVRAWQRGGSAALAHTLALMREEVWLLPVERLAALSGLMAAKDGPGALVYLRRHRQAVVEAALELGEALGKPAGEMLVEIGRLAAVMGDEEEAQQVLEQVPRDDPHRDEALRLLLDVATSRGKVSRSHYGALLTGAESDEQRLALLQRFLDASRGLGGFRDRNRPALNELLADPLSWLAEDPVSWGSLSQILMRSRDLESLLPHVLETFRKQSCRFLAPVLDSAMWQGPLALVPDNPRDQYWRGVALLHHYVACGASAEEALWEARELIAHAQKGSSSPLPHAWRDLHKAAFQWVAKNHYVVEAERLRMLGQLKIAIDDGLVVSSDVEQYLDQSAARGEVPPRRAMEAIEKLTRDRRLPALESKLILGRAGSTHLTNADLNRLWQLAQDRREGDFAWRLASILHARRALLPSVRHAWEISGEKRSQYPLVSPSKAALEHLVKGLHRDGARLALACLRVGAALIELLAILDPGSRAQRRPSAEAGSVEHKIDALLDGLSWLAKPRRYYRYSFDVSPLATPLPEFAQVLPNNPWSAVVARLGERMGLNAWGWKLSRLASSILDLVPRMASREGIGRHSAKVAVWLKALSPEQRSAWQDLAILARSLDDNEAQTILAIFLSRLATVIYPAHYMALTSLMTMRAPVVVIWDFERWLLSDSYMALRQEMGAASRVLVPNALQRLGSIVQGEKAS